MRTPYLGPRGTAAIALVLVLQQPPAAGAGGINYRDAFPPPDNTPTAQVNAFVINSGDDAHGKMLRFERLQFSIALQTPLNSDFNHPGDPVSGIITTPPAGAAAAVLPAGAELEGEVEAVKPTARPMQAGAIVVKFYRLRVGARCFSLFLGSNTADGAEHPSGDGQLSGKARLRNLLIGVQAMAVPFAIGSGGISIAITAGAGAVIGAALADDGKYLQGAVRGAWQASGLGVIDPLISKGKQVRLAKGTEIQLRLTDPLEISQTAVDYIERFHPAPDTARPPLTVLSTSARLFESGAGEDQEKHEGEKDSSRTAERYIGQVRRCLEDRNLAEALGTVDEGLASFPDCRELRELRSDILEPIKAAADRNSRSPEIRWRAKGSQ